MHPAKTKYSIVFTRQKIANSAKQSIDLSVDGMQLTKVESECVLGVYIDSHLTWNKHIDTLHRKLLQRAQKYLPTKCYCFFAMQVSNYSLLIAVLFGATACSQTNLDKLFKLRKRCAWLILDSPRDAWSFDNFQKLKWLPIDQMFKLNKLGLLRKVIEMESWVPEYLITSLDSLRFEHKYSTRTKIWCRLQKPRTEAMIGGEHSSILP